MNSVLVITSIIPVPYIEYKKTENDILFVTEDKIKNSDSSIRFKYMFIFPNANKLLSLLSKKWKSYYQLKNRKEVILDGRVLFLLPLFLLPKRTFFRNMLIKINLFLSRKKIDRLINEYKPTILHAQNADIDAYVARYLGEKYSIPYILTLRGLNGGIDSKIKRNIKSANGIIAISPRQQSLIKNLTTNNIQFIPHGLDDSFFVNSLREEGRDDVLKIITVARLMKLKNIDLVIKTLSKLKYKFLFDIYGDGEEREVLLELIRNLGLQDKIRVMGYISNDNLPNIYDQYDIFIMPSYPETLGRVYFEAMAAGLPVIASKNTGIDGMITEGKEGFLIDPIVNEDFFSDQLLDILKGFFESRYDLRQMSHNAVFFARGFHWNNIVPKYLNIYNQDSDE